MLLAERVGLERRQYNELMVNIKQIYVQPAKDDGYRVLVDRLWPRGMSKEKAAYDEWLKDVAPSNELRKWFSHKPERFNEFRGRYALELKVNPAFEKLKDIIRSHKIVTLLYAAHDEEHNEARLLQEFLDQA
jgi:uncharacterized protein YeaO (DUF488 family)